MNPEILNLQQLSTFNFDHDGKGSGFVSLKKKKLKIVLIERKILSKRPAL